MKSEAQKEAKRRYERTVKHFTLHMYKSDEDIAQFLENLPDGNKQDFVRNAIRYAMIAVDKVKEGTK